MNSTAQHKVWDETDVAHLVFEKCVCLNECMNINASECVGQNLLALKGHQMSQMSP